MAFFEDEEGEDPRDREGRRLTAEVDTMAATYEQVDTALAKLTLTPPLRPAFSPPTLHELVRYPSRGQLWVVTAQTGIGKTTFLKSVVDDFAIQGHRVAVLGLEQSPDELRLGMACLRAGVDQGVAIENSWMEQREGEAMFRRVQQALAEQAQAPLVDTLKFLPQRYINVDILHEAVEEAADWGAQIVVVDHIHHIQSKSGSFNEYKQLVQDCKRLAEEKGVVMLVAAQVGRRGAAGHGLMRFMPPEVKDIEGGDVLAQNANVILGLYRPVIKPETKEDLKRIKMAQQRLIEPGEVLRPHTMGVNVMKHRMRGGLDGRRVLLRLHHGKLLDLTSTVPY